MLNGQVRAVVDGEPPMLLKTIVAATSPWVRIPRPPLHALRSDLGGPEPSMPWLATFMAGDKPEPTPMMRVTAAMDEFMATVLRHLRTGQGNPWKNWAWRRQRTRYGTGGRISQVQEHRTRRGREVIRRTVEVARDTHRVIYLGALLTLRG